MVRTVDEGDSHVQCAHVIRACVCNNSCFADPERGGDDNETHCVAFVIDQEKDGELILSKPDCFGSEEDAETWTEIGLLQPAISAAIAANLGGGVTAFSTFTLGKHYDGFNGSGSSITIIGSSCSGGYWNTWTSWDNRISSSYNGCARLRHYDLPNKAGSWQNTYGAGTTDNLNTLNNRAESISYHSS